MLADTYRLWGTKEGKIPREDTPYFESFLFYIENKLVIRYHRHDLLTLPDGTIIEGKKPNLLIGTTKRELRRAMHDIARINHGDTYWQYLGPQEIHENQILNAMVIQIKRTITRESRGYVEEQIDADELMEELLGHLEKLVEPFHRIGP